MFTLIMRVIHIIMGYIDPQIVAQIARIKICKKIDFMMCKLVDLEKPIIEPLKKWWKDDGLFPKGVCFVISVYVAFITVLFVTGNHNHIWLRMSGLFIYQYQYFDFNDSEFIRYSLGLIPMIILVISWRKDKFAYYALFGFLQLQRIKCILMFWFVSICLFIAGQSTDELNRGWFMNIMLYYMIKPVIHRFNTQGVKKTYGVEESKSKIALKAFLIVVGLLLIQLPLQSREMEYRQDIRTQQREAAGIFSYELEPSGDFEVSEGGEFVATGNRKEVRIYRTIDKALVEEVKTPQMVRKKAFSPNGRYLALGYAYSDADEKEKTFIVYDMENKYEVSLPNKSGRLQIEKGKNNSGHIVGLSFSRDSRYLAVGKSNGLEIWDMEIKQLLERHDDLIWQSVEWINETQYVRYEKETDQLYICEVGADIQGKELKVIGRVRDIDISPDKSYVAVRFMGDWADGVWIYDMKIREWVFCKAYERMQIGGVKFAPDNKAILVALAKDPIIFEFYDFKSGNLVWQKVGGDIPHNMNKIEIIENGKKVLCGNDAFFVSYDLTK